MCVSKLFRTSNFYLNLSRMLNRLSAARLFLLIADAAASFVVRSDRLSPNLLPVVWRLPRLALVVVELVDLLKSHILGLVNEEPDEEYRDPGEGAPDPEDVGLRRVKSVGKVRCDERQEPVEEPVCGGSHRQTLGADLEREQLASHHPCSWTETRGEERDVNAEEDELSERRGVILRCVRGNTSNSHDVLANGHTQGANQQDRAAAKAVNAVQSRKSHENVDKVDNDLEDESIGKLLYIVGKERGAIVDLYIG